MKITQGIKKIIKPHVDAPTWVDLNFLSSSITNLVNTFKKVGIPKQATYQEEFEEAVSRLNLTEEILNNRLKEFRRLQFIFMMLALFSIFYLIILLLKHKFPNAIICSSFILIISSQSFRDKFWIFQIKQRKLGCTFKEWTRHLTKRT